VPVTCACAPASACGCDDNGDATYVQQFFTGANGTASNNDSVAQFVPINGTSTVVLNGSLPNGTDGSGTSGAERGVWVDWGGWAVIAMAVAGGLAVV